MHARFLLGLVGVLASGCATRSILPPSYFLDQSASLGRGDVAITAAGTGFGASQSSGAGGGLRARVGLGRGQELGVEAAEVAASATAKGCALECAPSDEPTRTASRNHSGKLTLASRVTDSFSVLAGVGATYSDPRQELDRAYAYKGSSLSGDLAGLLSTHRRGRLQGYGGLRVGVGGPLERTTTTEAGVERVTASTTVVTDVALGLSLHLDALRFYAEAGPFVVAQAGKQSDGGASVAFGLGLVF